jgi:hypothetical protein
MLEQVLATQIGSREERMHSQISIQEEPDYTDYGVINADKKKMTFCSK